MIEPSRIKTTTDFNQISLDAPQENYLNKNIPKDLSNPTQDSPLYIRPSILNRINTSVIFQDTIREGRPSIYLFIFVNPLSGDRKGQDLIQLPIQHFRLRKIPQVQVEFHNILDPVDRQLGIDNIQLVESMVIKKQMPSIVNHDKVSETACARHIHVWSAGGDGTVMSVFEMLVENKIDLNLLFFSCIPFGTGNDFSQVLGWGRTIPHKDLLGKGLCHLEQLIIERLESSGPARLDIWQVEMEAYPSGDVKLSGPQRKDGHDVLEINERRRGDKSPKMTKKMCNYMSIGLQGYVGSGFEKNRAGNRLTNMLVYTIESAKWVFWRRFPSVTNFIEKIECQGETVLVCPDPDIDPLMRDKSDRKEPLPTLTKNPIDFVIQNIPHIWGREVDLWGDAKYGLEAVENRSGYTDPQKWSPQLANDGKIEIMTIEDLISYLKKLANIRQHVSRIGQFETPFNIIFREPRPEAKKKMSWWERLFENKYKQDNVICIMCDGEFYTIKDPKSLTFKRFAQIWTLGKLDDTRQGRLVKDEITLQKEGEKHQIRTHNSF